MKLSRAEYIGVNNLVPAEQRDAYIDWSTQHYEEWTKEGHMIKHGSLDMLNTDPEKYNQYVSRKSPEATFIPDIERDVYHVRSTTSPPPRAYGPITNINIGSIGANQLLLGQVIELRNETLASLVKPFVAIPKDEHLGFHTDDLADHPHTFFHRAVYRDANDYNSEVVATITSVVAWDASMRDLLPENVKGIFCVIKNTCEQSFTYEIVGKEAVYKGEGDFHLAQFDDLEVEVDVSIQSHPNFTSTPNHCQYRIVSIVLLPNCLFAKEIYIRLIQRLWYVKFHA